MASGNVVIDSDMAYPILFIPKKCTTLETNCELMDNVYIDVSITSPDTEGNNTNIYSGFCNIKLVDSYDVNLNRVESSGSSSGPDIDQMPVILSDPTHLFPYNQSQVWIDPSRSPHVYNHYDPASQEQYTVCESGGLITVKQHNTYITQNVYNCKESNVFKYKEHQRSPVKDFERKHYNKQLETVTKAPETMKSLYYDEDEFECGVFLSQLPEEIMNEKHTRARNEQKFVGSQENNALKQLMSSDIQSTTKQRKTILFLGEDSQSGQTIQNISYDDPQVSCMELEVDNEVVIDSSSFKPKKKYQCDKCKQIFEQISSFRQHMVGSHARAPPRAKLSFRCNTCGKTLKNQLKFEMHCLGHGDPDLECSKCRKVFATKFSLRIHMKLHNRKYPCTYCAKSYAAFDEFKDHVGESHFLFMCQDENCSYLKECPDSSSQQHWHKMDGPEVNDLVVNDPEVDDPEVDDPEVDDPEVVVPLVEDPDGSERDLKAEVDRLDQDFLASQQLAADLARSRPDEPDFSLSPREQTPLPLPPLSPSPSPSPPMPPSLPLPPSPPPPPEDPSGERIRDANSVIAQVMSNKAFLLSSKSAKSYPCRKTCEVCLKTFDRIDDLKRHLIEHVIRSTLAKCPVSRSGILNITCEVCKMHTFSRVDKYKAHLREHAKLTIYKCTFCDKSFSDSSNFSKHKKIHGAAFLQCDLCHRKFNSKKMITLHMEQHRTTTPVHCKHCKKMFHFESMLNKHVRSVHKKEEISKYRCRLCLELFQCLKDKWDHEWLAHNVRKMIVDCLICGSQYRKYSELKRHCLDDHGMDIPSAKKLMKSRNVTNSESFE